jgi:hypothetical protein
VNKDVNNCAKQLISSEVVKNSRYRGHALQSTHTTTLRFLSNGSAISKACSCHTSSSTPLWLLCRGVSGNTRLGPDVMSTTSISIFRTLQLIASGIYLMIGLLIWGGTSTSFPTHRPHGSGNILLWSTRCRQATGAEGVLITL